MDAFLLAWNFFGFSTGGIYDNTEETAVRWEAFRLIYPIDYGTGS